MVDETSDRPYTIRGMQPPASSPPVAERFRRREIALFKRARLWKRCGDLREFVEAVRQLTEERPLPEGAMQEAAEWIEWATGVADAYDPLATWAEQLPERVQKPR
jgi:hypothetical protein